MGYLAIVRPINCLLAFISVLIGAWAGKEIFLSSPLIIAGFVGIFVAISGNIINDIKDIEIDRVNNPERPLVSGRVKKNVAWIMSLTSAGLAIIFGFRLGIRPFLLIILALILLYLYSYYFKKMPVANFIIAFVSGLSFVLGGIVVKNPLVLFPFLFALFIHLAREVVKDIIDIEGDQNVQVKSLPIILGPYKAQRIAIISLILLLVILPLPFLLHLFSLSYIIIALLGTYPIIIYIIINLRRRLSRTELKRTSGLLKTSMAIGLVALALS